MNERTRPVVVVVIVVALVAAAGGWWWSQRETGPRLGDYGRVTAVVAEGCMDLRISDHGLALQGDRPLPPAWRGTEVTGVLELTGRRGGDRQEGVEGTFTADDGVEIGVYGGREGEYFFKLGCGIWPDDLTG